MKSIFFWTWAVSFRCKVSAFAPLFKESAGLRMVKNSFTKVANYIDDEYEPLFEDSPIGVDALDLDEALPALRWEALQEKLVLQDPAALEIEDSKPFEREAIQADAIDDKLGHYPVAMMMHDCAPFIASHTGKTMVIHIPGNLITEDAKAAERLLSDIVTSYLLGMKIVIVVGTRFDSDSCPIDFSRPHECHNSLKVVSERDLRSFEEEAGFLRTEFERKINRCMHKAGNGHKLEGNVVSGNFYKAQRYGKIKGTDFEYAGFVSNVHTDNIKKVLADNDIVLLSTVGLCRMGDLVNVNGYHLAATVAAALNCYKLVYLANEGSILHKKGGGPDDIIQELPLSFAQEIVEYHNIRVHPKGFANFDEAQTELEPRAVELLLHLGWAGWALENGVKRAHIVNPTDGALLEELFTTANGANTCLFHDDELEVLDEEISEDEWDNYFKSARVASRNNSTVALFG